MVEGRKFNTVIKHETIAFQELTKLKAERKRSRSNKCMYLKIQLKEVVGGTQISMGGTERVVRGTKIRMGGTKRVVGGTKIRMGGT